jgi:hypothetical protein
VSIKDIQQKLSIQYIGVNELNNPRFIFCPPSFESNSNQMFSRNHKCAFALYIDFPRLGDGFFNKRVNGGKKLNRPALNYKILAAG